MDYFILKDREVIRFIGSFIDWAEIFESADRTVGRDKAGGSLVSTVFVGMDLSLGQSPKPLVFETMTFGGKADGYQARYATWDEAARGHEAAVLIVRGGDNGNG